MFAYPPFPSASKWREYNSIFACCAAQPHGMPIQSTPSGTDQQRLSIRLQSMGTIIQYFVHTIRKYLDVQHARGPSHTPRMLYDYGLRLRPRSPLQLAHVQNSVAVQAAFPLPVTRPRP